MDYTEQEIREQLRRGPDEYDIFRLKVKGDGSTKWLNVPQGAIVALADALSEAGPLQRIADILAEPNWSVGMLEDIAEIVNAAGIEPRGDRQPYYHH
jgi:hypothetical protein